MWRPRSLVTEPRGDWAVSEGRVEIDIGSNLSLLLLLAIILWACGVLP